VRHAGHPGHRIVGAAAGQDQRREAELQRAHPISFSKMR
jgi:hypothetical protein